MCGLVLALDDVSFDLEQTCKSIGHRGPTSTKYYVDSRLKCGFNRLAIVDSDPCSDQPMVDRGGRWLLMFNGQIYNFRELRAELAQRHSYEFATQSDTEVLLIGLGYEGRHFVEKLNGIYAFIFVDLQTYTMLAGRDPFGVKPLYYTKNQQSFYFCSEVKPLAQVTGSVPNRQSLALLLSSGSTLMGDSLYSDIKSVKPNTLIEISRNGVSEFQARHLAAREHRTDASEDEIIGRLAEATERQLPSIEFGLQLSGGIDSTLLLSFLSKSRSFFGTYAVNVNDSEMSEKSWQDIAVANFGSGKSRRVINLGVDDFQVAKIRDVISTSDLPFFHPSFIGATLMARQANDDGLKVLISGEGADELFLGYRWFYEESPIESIFEYSPLEKLSRYLGVKKPDMSFLQEIDRLEFFQKWYLQRWLTRSDLTGMRHSVEVRVPFLDLDLVEAINAIGREYKIRHGAKWILKNQLAKTLPQDFIERRKRGFDFPLNAWMTDDHIHLLKENRDLFNMNEKEIDALGESSDYWDRRLIFALSSFALWSGR